MLDINYVRKNKEAVEAGARNKNVEIDLTALLVLDEHRRGLRQKIDSIEQQRNALAQSTKGAKPSTESIEQGKQLRTELDQLEQEFADVDKQFQALLATIPNLPTADTPIGPDAHANKVLRQVGHPPEFSFPALDHVALGNALNLIDSERAAKVSGTRFAYIKGELAWLEFALIQFALSIVTNEATLNTIIANSSLNVPATPFIPVIPPVLIKPEALERMARLDPKEDRYYIPSDDLYLVGSAEHTLGAMHMDETFKAEELPVRYVGYSTSFRRESGSYGKDVKGILRVHQFNKLEFESFCAPEHSSVEQDFFVAVQEHLMQQLKLPYQVVLVSTGDMGKPDARQIDIETWLPGQGQYRETHSADLTTDYQSRRLKIKVKLASGGSEYVHMNDATVFAIGRMLIAILENYQQPDGSVTVPEVLQPFVPFKKISRT